MNGINSTVRSCLAGEHDAHADTTSHTALYKMHSEMTAILAELVTARIQLDGNQAESLREVDICIILDRMRVARQRCDELAEDMLKAHPQTGLDGTVKHEALCKYYAQIEVDRMIHHPFLKVIFLVSSDLNDYVHRFTKQLPLMLTASALPWKLVLDLSSFANL